MDDESKTRAQLIAELTALRQRNAELERSRKDLPQMMRETEERSFTFLNDGLDSAAVGISIVNAEWTVVWVNRAFERYFGLRREEIVGQDNRALIRERLSHIIAEPKTFAEKVLATYRENTFLERFECRVLPEGDREERWLEHWSQPIRSGLYLGGRIEQYCDITLWKKTADELKLQTAYLEKLIASAPEAIAVLDPTERVVRINREFTNLFDYAPDHAIGRPINDLVAPTYLRDEAERLSRTVIGGGTVKAESVRRRRDGSLVQVSILGTPISADDGTTGIYAIYRDITKRKEAEEALKSSERRLADIINFLPDATLVIDTRGRVIAWNQAMEQMSRVRADEILGKGDYEYALPFYGVRRPILIDLALSSDHQTEKLYHSLKREGETLIGEVYIPSRQGGVHLWGKARPLRDSQGNVVGAIEAIRDFTEKKKAEEERQNSEEKMRRIIEASPIGIRIIQHDRFAYVNPAFVRMFGYSGAEEILGEPSEAAYAPQERGLVHRRRRARLAGEAAPSFYELQGLKKNGETFDISVWVTVIEYQGEPAVLGFVVDKSAEKSLRAQLLQAQKMEAIGTLAGGVAHDFNNLLQAVQGYAELLLIGKNMESPGYRELHEIIRAAKRGGELTRQLLTFSRKMESRLRPIDLNYEVNEVYKILIRTIPKMIQIELQLAPDLRPVNADPVQVEQVMMNLAINAKDAMPQGGRLTIKTRTVRLGRDYCRKHPEARPGQYALLVVTDTGQGMESEILERVFEPFFTTKGVGKGTGLGLSTVYGIVKGHGGHITCASEPGVGTRFEIYLPVAKVDDKDLLNMREREAVPKWGNETVLLVEDEDFVAGLACETLTRSGYTVLMAPDGETALSVYEKERARIDLVILDLIMPGMGGSRCFEELMRMNPRVKIIIASGHSPDGYPQEFLDAGAREFLRKPYEMSELLGRVRNVLDEA
jgi:two-component system cell cycle sensor histidine kinase/response regulator CckA